MKAISDAHTCKDRRTYVQGRLQVRAGKVASISVEDAVHCKDGCSALQRRLQCTAGAVAVHCVFFPQTFATFASNVCILCLKRLR